MEGGERGWREGEGVEGGGGVEGGVQGAGAELVTTVVLTAKLGEETIVVAYIPQPRSQARAPLLVARKNTEGLVYFLTCVTSSVEMWYM